MNITTKIYNEEIIFDEPLESLDKFKIIFTDKNDKIPDTKDTKDSKNILKKFGRALVCQYQTTFKVKSCSKSN